MQAIAASSPHAMSFADLLRRYRLVVGLSQEALAERAGLSAKAIGALERGERTAPRADTLNRLAEALELSRSERAELALAARTGTPALHLVETRMPGAPPLPRPLTSLVGRQADAAAVCALLRDPAIRWLTLTGPGGVGKTRLALEVAGTLSDNFPDGVWFVPLASVRDPTLVLPTIAYALGLRDAGDETAPAVLARVLRAARSLLVLDNVEQVAAAATGLAELLAACPSLTVLLTSRALLRVSGEHAFPVRPLPAPPAGPLPVEQLVDYSAVHLFRDRARAACPDFALDEHNASAVGELCRRLDGLPLALELGAGWLRALPLDALLSQLDQGLPLLTGGPADQPDRLRTMRAAIAWSYDLLTAEEQGLFRRLAVFAGGFTLEAAAMMTAGDAVGRDVLTGIAALVDASLLQAAPAFGIEPRFVMLETIREFGLEQLTARGEEVAVRSRHAAFVLSLAESAKAALWGGPQFAEWRRRLEVELDNLRTALSWLTATGNTATALQVVSTTARFWYFSGRLTEGRGWLERAFAAGGVTPAEVRATAPAVLAIAEVFQHEEDRAVAHAEEALGLAVAAGDRPSIAVARYCRSIVAYQLGDGLRAVAEANESMALYEELGQPAAANNARFYLARAELDSGNGERAATRLAECRRVAEGLSDPDGAARAHGGLATLARRRGNNAQALAHFQAGLQYRRNLDEPEQIALYLEGIAEVAAADAVIATRLLGAADALRTRLGAPPIAPQFQSAREQAIAVLRTQLGDRFDEAWHAGRRLPLDQAVTEALALEGSAATPVTKPLPSSLTGRA